MTGAGGKNWRADADSAIPGSSAQAVRDAATFFEVENVAHTEWKTFNKETAARIAQPVLYVIGGENTRLMEPVADVFKSWIPQTEVTVIPETNHSLHYRRPQEVAAAIHEFAARHRS